MLENFRANVLNQTGATIQCVPTDKDLVKTTDLSTENENSYTTLNGVYLFKCVRISP